MRHVRQSSQGFLKKEVKHSIIGVVIGVSSFIVILAFFSAAGPTGNLLLATLRRLFGWVAFIVPFALIALSYYLIRASRESLSRLTWVGVALMTVGILGILHLVGVSAEDAYQVALDGRGGGLIGFSLSFPASRAFSRIAAGCIFVASLLTGIFLTFNLSPSNIWNLLARVASRRRLEDSEDDLESSDVGDGAEKALPTFRVSPMGLRVSKPDPDQLALNEKQAETEREHHEQIRRQLRAANRRYQPPDIAILHSSVGQPDSGNIEQNNIKIQSTLEKFGIPVVMGKVSIGPTVTRYTLRPEEGVKLSRITALQNDLALALAAHPIRIEAPIPNTNLVGIEIPNKNVSLVRLRDLFSSRDFRSSVSPLTIAMGKDVAGRPYVTSLEGMPHLLVAGATGSGKSIFINTLILALLYRNSPSLMRLIIVDPKRVELTLFNGIPHLLTPVITEPSKTINALKWAVSEMDRRYHVLSDSGARNIMSFNANNPAEALPLIVIVIDELADLMATHARDVEGMIVRLCQMARAIGIHLVLATQRPSVNVITGLIKANIPSRVAFNVASQIDSRTILDAAGAEKLLGSGDMLFLPGDQSKPIRLQGGYVSEEEVRSVVKDLIEKNDMEFEYSEEITSPTRDHADSVRGPGDDSLFEEAKKIVLESGKASASLLQRRLRVGYARAARLLDILEEHGVIGQQEGNKPREILVTDERLTENTKHDLPGSYEDRTFREQKPWQ